MAVPPESGSCSVAARTLNRSLVPESGGDGRCSGRRVILDIEMSAKPTDEIGKHRIYDAVRNAVEAATAADGAGTSDTERVNSS